MIQKLNRTTEILLFSILAIFPFAYEEINPKWYFLLVPVLMYFLINTFLISLKKIDKLITEIYLPILFLLFFDYSERVNFSQLLSVPFNIGWHLPLSTIVLSLAMISYLIKILIERKVSIIVPEYVKYFIFSFGFLAILSILFFPFMYHHYQIGTDAFVGLLNKGIKYFFLVFLVSNCTWDDGFMKKINLGFILIISVVLILKIIF
jgi:hypothetical protein